MEWILLTVFTANKAAIAFYERMGFSPDETSPCMTSTEPSDYEIYSKSLGPAKPSPLAKSAQVSKSTVEIETKESNFSPVEGCAGEDLD